jgi:peroxiredoxin
MAVAVGTRAPSFRLPSGQGSEVGLEDYRARSHALVWFTKGIACPFCRRQMVQIGKLYPRLCELGAEILLVAPTRPEHARLYLGRFSVPYPYLCDPGYQVRRAWGLEVRQSAGAYMRMVRAGWTLRRADVPEPDDVGIRPGLREMPVLLTDEDAGLFLVDREGVVRWSETGAYVGASSGGPVIRPLPPDGEILRAVAAL